MKKRLAALVLTLLLAGCGGGIYLGWSHCDGCDDGDGAPSVSITAAQTSVSAGGTLRVVAAASDQSGIDEVAFYRVDAGADTRLGSDGSAPYEWDVPVPADGRSSLTVYARARDGAGNSAQSNRLTVSVTP